MRRLAALIAAAALALPVVAADPPAAKPAAPAQPKPKAVAIIDPDAAAKDADFVVQGEYAGEIKGEKRGIHVIALGDGKFRGVGYDGGLPGDGWDPSRQKWEAEGGRGADGVVTITSEHGTATIKDGVLTVTSPGGEKLAEFKRVTRQSPTLGAKPPEGAVVLFDGKANDFAPGKTAGDLLTEGQNSKTKFGSVTLHLEFMLPYMPTARGQGRGNSGVYLQGRYECQVLDSFGLKGENNECGGIYTIAKPRVNMCHPPLQWQTYDIDYTAAVYDGGKKVKNATITVKHNGVVIHENVELPKGTTAAPVKEGAEPGPLHLQNHGNPVRFRNVWIVNK
ncbi:MAG TPA: DUF1080 domain-containing protein [Tepidisphaeraceae bacterium]|nr:DUF1080 domain-containing protein [Tepidisphaeraceae bacterium]